MSLPIWMLLGFAMWTIALLLFTVGIYRWSRILTGRVEIKEFRADNANDQGWYTRAMRAHANCVENLPIFGVVVFALYASGVTTPAADSMAVTVLVTRILQSITHVGFTQSNGVAFIRFLFFLAQIVCFIGMAAVIALQAL